MYRVHRRAGEQSLQRRKTRAKTPHSYAKTVDKRFPTKGAAKKFAIEQRKKAKQAGEVQRYEIQVDETTGEFKVRQRIWATDNKGRLV